MVESVTRGVRPKCRDWFQPNPISDGEHTPAGKKARILSALLPWQRRKTRGLHASPPSYVNVPCLRVRLPKQQQNRLGASPNSAARRWQNACPLGTIGDSAWPKLRVRCKHRSRYNLPGRSRVGCNPMAAPQVGLAHGRCGARNNWLNRLLLSFKKGHLRCS